GRATAARGFASVRPTELARERVELRRVRLLHRRTERPLAAAQDVAIVRHGRRRAAQLAAALDDARVAACGVEAERARAPERIGGDDPIPVTLGEQDTDLVARPRGSVRAVRFVQEIKIKARIAHVGPAGLLPERRPLPRVTVAEIPRCAHAAEGDGPDADIREIPLP